MATQPTNDLLVWANADVNLPNLAGPNKTEPSADLVAKGWDFKQKPSADEFNYILNNLSEWVEYLKTFTSEGTPLNTPSTLVKRDAAGNFAASMITSNLTGNASTSTTLQTERTINGTPFNGSSDITTSKWGTERTLALTGAVTGSVSVDGSGNVSMATSYASDPQQVSVITGTVLSGGTIPLPSGYTEGQCRWIASLQSINAANDISDLYVTLSGRVVTVAAESGETWTNATAMYMCIGVK